MLYKQGGAMSFPWYQTYTDYNCKHPTESLMSNSVLLQSSSH